MTSQESNVRGERQGISQRSDGITLCSLGSTKTDITFLRAHSREPRERDIADTALVGLAAKR